MAGAGSKPVRRRGRPLKASEALGKRVGVLVAKGVPPATAAVRCGLSRTAHFSYLKDAEHARAMYPGGDFPERVRPIVAYSGEIDAALAEFEERLVGVLVDGLPDEPRLALQVLARRFPADWREQRSGGAKLRTAATDSATSEDGEPPKPRTFAAILAAAPGGTPARAV